MGFSRHITRSEEDLIRTATEKDGAELLLQMVHKCLFEIDELRKELKACTTEDAKRNN